MKWYILTDLEGACRVNRWAQTRTDEPTPANLEAKGFLTAEVNAAVAGLLDADPAGEVLVWDGHGSGGLINAEVDPRAWFIARGATIDRRCGLDESFAGLLYVGQHAMAGTPAATLCHTYSSKTIEWFELNGQRAGELGCRAAMAGAMGVPTIFLAGDDKAAAEAKAIIPEIVTVTTKISLGIELALHRPPATVLAEIRAGAARAASAAGDIPPRLVTPPYTLVTRVLEGCSIDHYLRWPGARQIDERTVEATAADLTELWI